MPIQERHIQGPIRPNMLEALCTTCWSAGKVLFQKVNGFKGSDEISHVVEFQADDAVEQHMKAKGDHKVTIYHWKNDPVDKNDVTIRAGDSEGE